VSLFFIFILSFVALCGGARSRRALFIRIRDDDSSRRVSGGDGGLYRGKRNGGEYVKKKICN